jgi:hypothetical protein
MIEIKTIPYENETQKKINEYPTVIKAYSWEEACGKLITSINEDMIDTENNILVSVTNE